jgi:hypothetical protein
VLISPYPDQEGNKLQRHKILSYEQKKNIATSGKLNKAVQVSYGYVYFLYKLVRSARVWGGADKSLAQPGKEQVPATENFDFHISYL